MNGDINPDPDPRVELVARRLSCESWGYGAWESEISPRHREAFRDEARELLEELDSLKSEPPESLPGTTTLSLSESG